MSSAQSEPGVTQMLCFLNGHQPVLERVSATTTPAPITCGCGSETYVYMRHEATGGMVLVNAAVLDQEQRG